MTFGALIVMFDGLLYSRRDTMLLFSSLLRWPWSSMMATRNEGGSLLTIWIAERAMTSFAADRTTVISWMSLPDLWQSHCLLTHRLHHLSPRFSLHLHPDDLAMRLADHDRPPNSVTAFAARTSIASHSPPSTSSAISKCLDCGRDEHLPSGQMSATGWVQAYAVWCACQQNGRTVDWTGTQANRVGDGHYY